jgi:transcriptional antiterminator RfaH
MQSPNWYALRSKPRQEDALYQRLLAEAVEVYYPRLPVRTVNPRARKVRPYFPGYMFVRIDLADTGMVKFQWMYFSAGLVCFDDIPAPVPDTVIEGIRKTIDRLTCNGRQYYDELAHGQAVRVRSGPLEGYYGIFDTRISGGERVRLLLELLSGQTMTVEMDADRVEATRRTTPPQPSPARGGSQAAPTRPSGKRGGSQVTPPRSSPKRDESDANTSRPSGKGGGSG